MKLKLFRWEQHQTVVVVVPAFDGRAFRYQDLQLEANTVRAYMQKPGQQHLVIDLGQMDYFGSEFLNAVVLMLRETKARGGKGCFCSAGPDTLAVLTSAGLCKVWPHFESRALALTECRT